MENSNSKIYNKIHDIVNEIDSNSKEVRLLLGVIDYDSPYLLHYEVSLHLNGFRNSKIKVFDFLIRIDMLHEISILEQKK